MENTPQWAIDLLATLDPDGSRSRVSSSSPVVASVENLPVTERRLKRAIAYVSKMPGGIQGSNGSGATYEAACAVVHGFALGVEDGFRVLWDHHNPLCVPPWSESELRHKCEDAANKAHLQPPGYLCTRGDELPELEDGVSVFVGSPGVASPAKPVSVAVGQPDAAPVVVAAPAEEFLNEADDDPHRIARGFLARYTHPDGATLSYWRDEFYEWRRSHWEPMTTAEVEAEVNGSARRHFEGLQREYQRRANAGELQELPKMGKVTCSLVSNVSAAIRQMTILRGVESPPAWVRGGSGPEPREIVSAKNGLVNLPAFVAGDDNAILPPSPRYFNTNAVSFSVSRDAAEPREWLKFLAELWPTDAESISLLQEWFGYLLTPDTAQQKMLLMIGPRRSGKGTISTVLQSLVGQANCCGPTLSGLAGPFGLAPLLGKSVAVIEDARLSSRADAAVVVERLLAISGAGTLTVERKHLDSIDARLSTRFVVSTNEIPRLTDVSGALASRWCVLRFVESFEGREDIGLASRLLAELPGIFLWAVEGWKRLTDRQRFTKPESSEDLVETMEESGSPIGTFIKDKCEIGRTFKCPCTKLYEAWIEYCGESGQKEPGTNREFGRVLRASLPQLKRHKIRTRDEGLINGYIGIGLKGDIGTIIDLFDEEPCTHVPVVPVLNPLYVRSEKEEQGTHTHYIGPAIDVPQVHGVQNGYKPDSGVEL